MTHASPDAAVKQARSATKVLFDSDYSSINVSEVLSAMESDPKMVYVTESELLSTPIIKLGVAFEFFTSMCACFKGLGCHEYLLILLQPTRRT